MKTQAEGHAKGGAQGRTVTRTEGHAAVEALRRRLGGAHLARVLGVSEALVRALGAAQRMPGPEVRRKLVALGVPLTSWDVQGSPGAVKAGTDVTAGRDEPSVDPPDAKREVITLLDIAKEQLAAARADASVTYRERASFVVACTGLIRLLARLSGQLEVTEVALLRSPAWARAMRIVREVLSRHPGVLAELDDSLEKFANGES